MKELVDSIADMRCLSCVILQNNGIDESYLEELGMILILINE